MKNLVLDEHGVCSLCVECGCTLLAGALKRSRNLVKNLGENGGSDGVGLEKIWGGKMVARVRSGAEGKASDRNGLGQFTRLGLGLVVQTPWAAGSVPWGWIKAFIGHNDEAASSNEEHRLVPQRSRKYGSIRLSGRSKSSTVKPSGPISRSTGSFSCLKSSVP